MSLISCKTEQVVLTFLGYVHYKWKVLYQTKRPQTVYLESRKTVAERDDMSCLISQGSFRKMETSLGLWKRGNFIQKFHYAGGGKAEKPDDKVKGHPEINHRRRMQPRLFWSIRERAGITKAQKLVEARTTSEGLCGGSRRSRTPTGDSIGSRGTLRRTTLVFLVLLLLLLPMPPGTSPKVPGGSFQGAWEV